MIGRRLKIISYKDLELAANIQAVYSDSWELEEKMDREKERPQFVELNNLCSAKNGAEILFATDDWFAAAENLIQDSEPVWKEGVFDDCGKWMDGWETRRKRIPGHDWSIIKLAYPGVIHGVELDTAFFTGNYVPKISIQAATLTAEDLKLIPKRRKGNCNGQGASKTDLEKVEALQSDKWEEIVPKSKLGPGYADTRHNFFPVESRKFFTHLRLNLYPDGGIARLRVFGRVYSSTPKTSKGLVDLLSMENGGLCLAYSNAHYGHPRNLIQPNQAENMGEGWETARRLDRPEILVMDSNGVLKVPGCEWATFKLGIPGTIEKIEIETFHFKGNFPDSVIIYASDSNNVIEGGDEKHWEVLLPVQKLGPHQTHTFEKLNLNAKVTQVKICIAPDGGIARVRMWGIPEKN